MWLSRQQTRLWRSISKSAAMFWKAKSPALVYLCCATSILTDTGTNNMTDPDSLSKIFEVLAGNSITGAVLVWFMMHYAALVKQLSELIKANTEALTKMDSAMERVTRAVEKCEVKK